MSPSFVLSVKRWITKSYCWKGFNYAKDAGEPKIVQDLEELTAQDKQETREQPSLNIKTVVS